MGKIKVLHIIKSLGRGGAEMLLPETLKLHDQQKFEFHYIYFLPWKNQMVEDLEINGGTVSCFASNNNISLLLQYKKVIIYCKKYEIDLIHCHLPWSGFLGRIIHKKTNIPVVYTEHNIQERYHKATKILNKYTFNYQSLALGVSEDVTRSIKENIASDILVKTLLNGVNTERFIRNDLKGKEVKRILDIPKNAIVIGNIAVFRKQKNLTDWIKAFQKISENSSEVYGILVGAGTQEAEIKALIEELGLVEKIKLAGLQKDTVSYFSAMDIFMMSSSFEGLPIALLEAMSMECAIVSTKAGGVVEVVKEQETGLLCEVGDWEDLSRKTLSLIKNKYELGHFQIAARKRVVDSFSLKNMVEKLEGHYQSLYI